MQPQRRGDTEKNSPLCVSASQRLYSMSFRGEVEGDAEDDEGGDGHPEDFVGHDAHPEGIVFFFNGHSSYRG